MSGMAIHWPEELRSALPEELRDLSDVEIAVEVTERLRALTVICIAMGMAAHSNVDAIVQEVQECAEFIGRSTAEMDLSYPQEMIQMSRRIELLESENQHLQAQSERLQRISDPLAQTAKRLARHPS